MTGSGIYQIELGNGHFYVGSAANLETRERQHRSDLKSQSHCNKVAQRCWNKYGYFKFSVLEECEKEALIAREQFYLDQHFFNPKNVNIAPVAGSSLGIIRSLETRAKIGAWQKGRKLPAETRAKMSASAKGKQRSPEHTKNLSASLKGRIFSPEHLAKMSAAGKGKTHSLATRAKLSAANKGKTLSSEHRAKIAAAAKGRIVSAETRAKLSQAGFRRARALQWQA